MGDSRTCSDVSGHAVKGGGSKGFMLFGVRVVESSFRKSVSMINLAQYDEKLDQDSNIDVSAAGYLSDDVVHPSGRICERKKGVPWTEEEHKLFLLGLQKVGKGDWRGISRNFVKTRTPTQVASHAQKYFIRRNNQNGKRRRSSLFDITADPALGVADEDKMHQDNLPQTPKIQYKVCKTQEKVSISITHLIVPITTQNSLGQINQLNNSPKPIRPIPILPLPLSSKMANLNLKNTMTQSLSLKLSLSSHSQPASSSNQQLSDARHISAFQVVSDNFNGSGGDNIISVA